MLLKLPVGPGQKHKFERVAVIREGSKDEGEFEDQRDSHGIKGNELSSSQGGVPLDNEQKDDKFILLVQNYPERAMDSNDSFSLVHPDRSNSSDLYN